jgi:hypothetical protein
MSVESGALGRRRGARAGARRPCRWLPALASLVATAVVVLAPPVEAAGPVPLTVEVRATDGAGTVQHPGRSCAEGGAGAYWHYDYGAKLAPKVFSSLPGDIRVHLDLHSDAVRFPNTGGAYPPPPPGATAFLQGSESHASLLNQRGSLKLRLASGSCASPTLAFDGSVATGAGSWTIGSDGGAGAYRQATGAGTFGLTAEVNPGADNALTLKLNGTIQVLQPALKVEQVGAYWGGLGIDYLTRRVTVVYKVTNTGPGDSFGARMLSATSPTPGVKALGPQGQPLGDLLANDAQLFTVRYELGLDMPEPCDLVILGCQFDTSVTVRMPDALDVAQNFTASGIRVKAPDLPPPLSEVSVT